MSNAEAGWFSRLATRANEARNIILLVVAVGGAWVWLDSKLDGIRHAIEGVPANAERIAELDKRLVTAIQALNLTRCELKGIRPLDCDVNEGLEEEGH